MADISPVVAAQTNLLDAKLNLDAELRKSGIVAITGQTILPQSVKAAQQAVAAANVTLSQATTQYNQEIADEIKAAGTVGP